MLVKFKKSVIEKVKRESNGDPLKRVYFGSYFYNLDFVTKVLDVSEYNGMYRVTNNKVDSRYTYWSIRKEDVDMYYFLPEGLFEMEDL